ncbi:MAG: hypothetical protein M1133_14800 [Armatimonadetes bacterium]|nr:hypothetical protein [Armatimonadota bacterium]
MTQLDLFKATVDHQQHSDFLYYAHFTPALLESMKMATGLNNEHEILQSFGAYTPVGVAVLPPPGLSNPDFSGYFTDVDIPARAFINHLGVLEIPGSAYHFTQYVSPLRNAGALEDIEEFPYPSLTGYSNSHMRGEVEQAHKQGLVAFCWVGHMYEDAWQIRGYEEFLMDLIAAPEMCEFILDRVMERNLANATAAASAGVDFIQSGDDVANQRAMMFDPELWRMYMKPRWARVYEAARNIKPDIEIWYHSDGNIEEIIPELIDIGVTILNPVQPECMDLVRLKKEYGKHLVLDGTVGTQTTMPFGDSEEVEQVVLERKRVMGVDGGLILSPTHVLEPEVPVENIIALFKAAGR